MERSAMTEYDSNVRSVRVAARRDRAAVGQLRVLVAGLEPAVLGSLDPQCPSDEDGVVLIWMLHREDGVLRDQYTQEVEWEEMGCVCEVVDVAGREFYAALYVSGGTGWRCLCNLPPLVTVDGHHEDVARAGGAEILAARSKNQKDT